MEKKRSPALGSVNLNMDAHMLVPYLHPYLTSFIINFAHYTRTGNVLDMPVCVLVCVSVCKCVRACVRVRATIVKWSLYPDEIVRAPGGISTPVPGTSR